MMLAMLMMVVFMFVFRRLSLVEKSSPPQVHKPVPAADIRWNDELDRRLARISGKACAAFGAVLDKY